MDRVPKGPNYAIRVLTRTQSIPPKSLSDTVDSDDSSDPREGEHQSPHLLLSAHPNRYGDKHHEQRQE